VWISCFVCMESCCVIVVVWAFRRFAYDELEIGLFGY